MDSRLCCWSYLLFLAINQRGVVGIRDYSLTVFVAFTTGFLGIVFVPWGSRWVQLGVWLLPISLPIVASLQGYGGGWIFGYLLGLLVAADVRGKRHKRAVATDRLRAIA